MIKRLCSMIGILFANLAFSQCPPTTPTITGTPVLCDGASGYLSAAGSGDTYTWSPGGANTASISISPGSTTTYSVLMGQTGCTLTASAVITVTVANTPTVTATVPSFSTTATSYTTCGGNFQFPAFEASGASSYTWSTGANTATISVYVPFSLGAPTYTNVYTVTGHNACGTSTTALSLIVFSFPSLNITASQSTICPGQSVTLKATGSATNYVWKISGLPAIIATTASVVVSPANTTTYEIEAYSNSSCLRHEDITINVSPCTDVEELSAEAGIRLYPNPVTDLLYIDVNDNPGEVILEVYDVAGKILIREPVSGSGNTIHTDVLQAGIYFYKLAGKAGKFMKQ